MPVRVDADVASALIERRRVPSPQPPPLPRTSGSSTDSLPPTATSSASEPPLPWVAPAAATHPSLADPAPSSVTSPVPEAFGPLDPGGAWWPVPEAMAVVDPPSLLPPEAILRLADPFEVVPGPVPVAQIDELPAWGECPFKLVGCAFVGSKATLRAHLSGDRAAVERHARCLGGPEGDHLQPPTRVALRALLHQAPDGRLPAPVRLPTAGRTSAARERSRSYAADPLLVAEDGLPYVVPDGCEDLVPISAPAPPKGSAMERAIEYVRRHRKIPTGPSDRKALLRLVAPPGAEGRDEAVCAEIESIVGHHRFERFAKGIRRILDDRKRDKASKSASRGAAAERRMEQATSVVAQYDRELASRLGIQGDAGGRGVEDGGDDDDNPNDEDYVEGTEDEDEDEEDEGGGGEDDDEDGGQGAGTSGSDAE